MGKIRKPDKVKLVIGVIYNRDIDIADVEKLLEENFGPKDMKSPVMDFLYTDYYNKEMCGPPLYKKLYSYENLIEMDFLSEVKITTNSIEAGFLKEGCRNCNIDPGYLSLSRFILASTKDFSHRIYIGRGIFGDLTLIYKNKSFCELPWTYPDFRSGEYKKFLADAREKYRKQMEENKE